MDNTINLHLGKLILLSGVPGSGKSTLLKNNNIPKDFIVSSDEIRSSVLGNIYSHFLAPELHQAAVLHREHPHLQCTQAPRMKP